MTGRKPGHRPYDSAGDFVRFFRHAAPYVHAHRGRTFVVAFDGAAVQSPGFDGLIHDLALLHALGARLVLVHGARPQLEARVRARGVIPAAGRRRRVTDNATLADLKAAAGAVRVEVEARLSMGLPNSPMAGARLRVAAGNFVTARPLGIVDGVDFQHTGVARRVDAEGIGQRLDSGAVVLLSPLGYSITGDVFNLRFHDVASAVAVALGADKLLALVESDAPLPGLGISRELSPDEARRLSESSARREPSGDALPDDLALHLESAARACRGGVRRAQLIDRRREGGLLLELFTRDGTGTLVSGESFEDVRPARPSDVGGLLALIRPLADAGILVERPRELLERAIDDFLVVERDGAVIACAALHPFPNAQAGELACVAVHRDYRKSGRGDDLLAAVEHRACVLGLSRLFALTTRTAHWFIERGFEPTTAASLPPGRAWDPARRSVVLAKRLAPPGPIDPGE